jgi:hypothetical protein
MVSQQGQELFIMAQGTATCETTSAARNRCLNNSSSSSTILTPHKCRPNGLLTGTAMMQKLKCRARLSQQH